MDGFRSQSPSRLIKTDACLQLMEESSYFFASHPGFGFTDLYLLATSVMF